MERSMASESDALYGSDGPSRLEQAKEAVETVAETVQTTTRTVADAIEAGRRPGAPLYRLAEWTREAPMHSLAIAFLFGILIGRRR
jgi:ElaB/YqjD/DUF883 family membrane-anchored ribosome-binding protein